MIIVIYEIKKIICHYSSSGELSSIHDDLDIDKFFISASSSVTHSSSCLLLSANDQSFKQISASAVSEFRLLRVADGQSFNKFVYTIWPMGER